MAILGTALGKLDYTDVVGSLKKMERYLRNLQEELEFRLANLDSENFNETGLKEIGETITEPITVELEDTAGHISTLQQTAEGLSSTVSGLTLSKTTAGALQLMSGTTAMGSDVNLPETDLSGYATTSQLEQTAKGFTLTVSGQQLTLGNSVLSDDGSTVNLPETDLSNYTTTDDLTSALTGYASTNYVQSQISQTVNGISLSVQNGDEKSTFTLKSGDTTLSSGDIAINGMVTFSDLSTSGKTKINGGNITTGTINAMKMTGNTISGGTITGTTISGSTFKSLLTSSGSGDIQLYIANDNAENKLGGLTLGLTDNTNAVRLWSASTSDGAIGDMDVLIDAGKKLWLESGTGGISIKAGSGQNVYIEGANIYLVGNVYINGTKYYSK